MKIIKKITMSIVIVMLLWWVATTNIDAFKNPELTYTQRFLRMHKAFILDFSVEGK